MSYQLPGAFGSYDPASYPEGVPNPYVATVEPYPSYMYGNDYTRPQFAMPFVSQPHNVLRGLGTEESARRNKGILYGAGFMAAAAGLLALASVPPPRRLSAAVLTSLVGGVLGAVAAGIGASTAQGEL